MGGGVPAKQRALLRGLDRACVSDAVRGAAVWYRLAATEKERACAAGTMSPLAFFSFRRSRAPSLPPSFRLIRFTHPHPFCFSFCFSTATSVPRDPRLSSPRGHRPP